MRCKKEESKEIHEKKEEEVFKKCKRKEIKKYDEGKEVIFKKCEIMKWKDWMKRAEKGIQKV